MIKPAVHPTKNQETSTNGAPAALSEKDLGKRFIYRREAEKFWYVQIKVSVNSKRHYMEGQSFYDNQYGGKEASFAVARQFRDQHAYPFFEKVGYDPALRERIAEQARLKRERPKKFKKRKEATAGPMANLHYIHLYKRRGRYSRCVVDITVNVHGRHYHSTAYSYDFEKYGGKDNTLKIARQDRNRLAQMVHRKAMELEQLPQKPVEETRAIIKSIKITRTPPLKLTDPDKFIKRADRHDFWTVAVRRQLWKRYCRVPFRRFYDQDYGGKHKSRIVAYKYAELFDLTLQEELQELRERGVTDREIIQQRVDEVVEKVEIEIARNFSRVNPDKPSEK